MSFFNPLPNCTYNGVRVYSPAHLQTYYHIHARLNLITTALRNSLLSFQELCEDQRHRQHSPNQISKQSKPSIQLKERVELKMTETDKQHHFCSAVAKDMQQQKTCSPNIISSRLSPVVEPKMEIQCNRPQMQGVIAFKKSQNNKLMKEVSKQQLKDKEEDRLPQIDLNDCAYLPQLGMAYSQLAVLRQSLLGRRVEEWRGAEKGRRDRRQLRMLNS